MKKATGEVVSNYADLHAKLYNNTSYDPTQKVEYEYHRFEKYEDLANHMKGKDAESHLKYGYYGVPVYMKNKTKGFKQVHIHKDSKDGYYILKDSYNGHRRHTKKHHLSPMYVKLYDMYVQEEVYFRKKIKK